MNLPVMAALSVCLIVAAYTLQRALAHCLMCVVLAYKLMDKNRKFPPTKGELEDTEHTIAELSTVSTLHLAVGLLALFASVKLWNVLT